MERAKTLHVALLVSPWAPYRISCICSNQKACSNLLKDWVLPAIYKIGKVFGLNLTFCIFWASLIDVEVCSNSQISSMLQNAVNSTKIYCQLF